MLFKPTNFINFTRISNEQPWPPGLLLGPAVRLREPPDVTTDDEGHGLAPLRLLLVLALVDGGVVLLAVVVVGVPVLALALFITKFMKIAKIVKLSTSDTSFSAVSKRNLAT